MIAVIFEVTPITAGKDDYFAIAAQLAPMLSTIYTVIHCSLTGVLP